MKADDPRHGTCAGYQQHRRDGEVACAPCRDASRDYMRMVRSERKDVADRERASTRARSRALWRLASLYRDEYDRLYVDELRAEGVRKSVTS